MVIRILRKSNKQNYSVIETTGYNFNSPMGSASFTDDCIRANAIKYMASLYPENLFDPKMIAGLLENVRLLLTCPIE